MAKLTELNQYLIREKFFKIFGNKFHIMDENDQLYGTESQEEASSTDRRSTERGRHRARGNERRDG